MAYRIIEEKCVGCGACAWVCLFGVPQGAAPDKSKYEIPKEKCVGCGHCENICPNNAIEPCPDHRRLKKVTILPETASAAPSAATSARKRPPSASGANRLPSCRKNAPSAACAWSAAATRPFRRNTSDRCPPLKSRSLCNNKISRRGTVRGKIKKARVPERKKRSGTLLLLVVHARKERGRISIFPSPPRPAQTRWRRLRSRRGPGPLRQSRGRRIRWWRPGGCGCGNTGR